MQLKILIFILLSIPIALVSWRSLKSYKNHGFYRFFGWECLLWLIISNVSHWFINPFSPWQIFSWIFLFYSLFIVMAGFMTMKKKGLQHHSREEKSLYQFEKTTALIDTGIFRYIRHPMYGSLIFLSLGVFFKNPGIILLLVTVAAVLFFYITAIHEEGENIAYFGESYREYMKRTKRFVPFIW